MANLMDLIHQAGFQGQAATTMYAIVMAESGGNAQAHNGNAGTGDNSYGLAQINMLGSMGPARLAQYHLKSNNDLFDPLTNLKVAFQLSGGGRDFSPWTTYTRGTYKQYLGQSGASVSSAGNPYAGGGSPGATTNAAPANADYASALGQWGSLLQTVPQLKGLLQQAVTGGWSTTKFEQAVQQSAWWRTHSDAAKNLIGLQAQNPAEYTSRLNGAKSTVQTMASQLGVHLNAQQINMLAINFLSNSWDQSTLQRQVGQRYTGQGQLAGQAATAYDQLKKLYSDYGVPISEASLQWRVRTLLDGVNTFDAYKHSALASAQSMYPSLAHQLSTGATVRDIADPYIQQMGNLLEIDPNSIGISDPMIKRALQGSVVTTGGKSTATSTTLYDFEKQLRSDPRWTKTQNATDTISTALTHVGRDWGFGF